MVGAHHVMNAVFWNGERERVEKVVVGGGRREKGWVEESGEGRRQGNIGIFFLALTATRANGGDENIRHLVARRGTLFLVVPKESR